MSEDLKSGSPVGGNPKQPDTLELMHQRKNDHIRICIEQNVESANGVDPFAQVQLLPEALPECSLDDVDTQCDLWGHRFALPLLITGMTGGVHRGQEINEALAAAASAFNIPMGLGSQKMMLKDPSLARLFSVKNKVKNLVLIGNLGAVSLNEGYTVAHVQHLVEATGLDALALHVNALQECIQPEGECNFSGLLKKIGELCRQLQVPVVVKEVGSGMTPATIRRLMDCGVSAIDLGGSGGTSWSVIEGHRASAGGARLGELFRDWGLTTVQSLRGWAQSQKSLRSAISATQGEPGSKMGCPPVVDIIATGGVRNGIHVAKLVGLGARLAGVGLPLFRAVTSPPQGVSAYEALCQELTFFRDSLRIAMFCSGARTLSELPPKILIAEEHPFYGPR